MSDTMQLRCLVETYNGWDAEKNQPIRVRAGDEFAVGRRTGYTLLRDFSAWFEAASDDAWPGVMNKAEALKIATEEIQEMTRGEQKRRGRLPKRSPTGSQAGESSRGAED